MQNKPNTETAQAKILLEMSPEHHHSLLKRASEASPVYFRLKNAVKTEADVILVPCSADEAEMLLQVAKHFCPDAVSPIEAAIKAAHHNVSTHYHLVTGRGNSPASHRDLRSSRH
jgi:hypothetical protein